MSDSEKVREIKKTLIAIYKNTCFYCGAKSEEISIDHIVPRQSGGQNHIDNCVLCCHGCNSSKGDNDLEVWMHKIEGKMRIAHAEYKYRKAIFNKLKKILSGGCNEIYPR